MKEYATIVGLLLLLGCAGTRQPHATQARATSPAGQARLAQASSRADGATPTREQKDERKPAFRRDCRDYAGAPVQISYEDAPGGAAVIYRTRGNVEALRERTQEVARFHNSARGKSRWLHDLYQIPHRAYVAHVDGGAKLTLVPKGARRRAQDELRVHVQQDVWIMQREGCDAGQEAL